MATAAIPAHIRESFQRDAELSKEIQAYLLDLAAKMERGEVEQPSWDELHAEINRIAERHGVTYGAPMPSMYDIDRRLILARGSALQFSGLANRARTEMEEELAGRVRVRNSWVRMGDEEVAIAEVDGKVQPVARWMAGQRLRKLFDGAIVRAGTSQTAKAELRAMASLRKRINGNQWDHYVLNGCFPERSTRSDLHYLFRKGLPTLAFSYHSGYGGDASGGRVIAALCLHPLGYFQGTHVGLMCPTDEVICALLTMRADEHRFWKSSGQWSAMDTRSGI